jgi:thioredoxin reductase
LEWHNLLAQDDTPPGELRRIGREQIARYPGVRHREGTVDGAHALADEGFRLQLGGADSVEARRLLLATGLTDELPAIDGLAACGAAPPSTARTATASRSAADASRCWARGRSGCGSRCS